MILYTMSTSAIYAKMTTVMELVEKYKYTEASLLYADILEECYNQLGLRHQCTAIILHNAAELLRAQCKYKLSLRFYRLAYNIFVDTLGGDHIGIVNTLDGIAQAYMCLDMYEQALPFYEAALSIRERVHGVDHQDTAKAICKLASLHNDDNGFEAEQLYLKALRIVRNVSADNIDTAQVLDMLALLYSHNSRYVESSMLYRESLTIRTNHYGTVHPNITISLRGIAKLLDRQGKPKEAKEQYISILDIMQMNYGDKHPKTAVALNDLAWHNLKRNMFDSAEKYFRQALAIRTEVLGLYHVETIDSLDGYIQVCIYNNNYKYAKVLAQQQLTSYTKIFDAEHVNAVVALEQLAYILNKLGEDTEVEQLHLQLLRIIFKNLETETTSIIRYLQILWRLSGGLSMQDKQNILNNLRLLGIRYATHHEYGKAELFFRQMLDIGRTLWGPDDSMVAMVLQNIGVVCAKMGRYHEAESIWDHSLKIYRQDKELDKKWIAVTLFNVGIMYKGLGKYSEAKTRFAEALNIYLCIYGPLHPQTIVTKYHLAKLRELLSVKSN